MIYPDGLDAPVVSFGSVEGILKSSTQTIFEVSDIYSSPKLKTRQKLKKKELHPYRADTHQYI